VTQSIGDDDVQILEKDTNKAKVNKAIKDSKKETASGIDGVPYKFYKF